MNRLIREVKIWPKGISLMCTISGTLIKDAKLQEEDGIFYICQDKKEGSPCSDKLGYEYSYSLGEGRKEDIEQGCVTDLYIVNCTDTGIHKGDHLEGVVILSPTNSEYLVAEVCGLVILLQDVSTGEITYTTEDSLIKAKYTLKLQ